MSRYLTALKVFYLHYGCAKKHLIFFILNLSSAAFIYYLLVFVVEETVDMHFLLSFTLRLFS